VASRTKHPFSLNRGEHADRIAGPWTRCQSSRTFANTRKCLATGYLSADAAAGPLTRYRDATTRRCQNNGHPCHMEAPGGGASSGCASASRGSKPPDVTTMHRPGSDQRQRGGRVAPAPPGRFCRARACRLRRNARAVDPVMVVVGADDDGVVEGAGQSRGRGDARRRTAAGAPKGAGWCQCGDQVGGTRSG
jgi:hypothetical protein